MQEALRAARKLLRMTSAEQVRADDAQHAADGSADQALEADCTEARLEENDGSADQQADQQVLDRLKSKRMKNVAGGGY